MQLGEVKQNSVDPESGHSGDESPSTPRSAFALMLVSGGRLGNDQLGCKRRTWNTILFSGPRSQIRDLTTLRTEWTPGICFPCRGLVAQGTGHGRSVTSEPNEVQSLERRLIVRHCSWPSDLEQPLQPALIQIREAQELNTELAMIRPSNRGGMDGNRDG